MNWKRGVELTGTAHLDYLDRRVAHNDAYFEATNKLKQLIVELGTTRAVKKEYVDKVPEWSDQIQAIDTSKLVEDWFDHEVRSFPFKV